MSSSPSHPRVVVQDRDRKLMLGLFESRVMTRSHVADLYFEGKYEACKKRLQKLTAAGIVDDEQQHPNEPGILTLGRRGFQVLSDEGRVVHYPQHDWRSFKKRISVSDATIRHELQVMDVKAAFARGIRNRGGLTLAEFSTWPKLYEFRTRRTVETGGWRHEREVLMKPDGFIRIHEETEDGLAEHCFFLEVDRGTETLATIASKAQGYRAYFRSGDFARRMGCDPACPQHVPFRVLMVVPSKSRMVNISDQLVNLSPPIHTQVWLAEQANAAQVLGTIWHRPNDVLGGLKESRLALIDTNR